MSFSTLSPLLPVLAFIAIGFFVARRGWLGAAGIRELSTLVFLVLTPALLFRTMSRVHLDGLNYYPVASYFSAVALLFAAVLWRRGWNRKAGVLAIASTFSNTVMVGIPLITLTYGPEGQLMLFTLVSVHSLILLTAGTIVLEAMSAPPAFGLRSRILTLARIISGGIFHPVPLPILAGLLFSFSGLRLPAPIDNTLELLGAAMSPLALILVGASVCRSQVALHFGSALSVVATKNLIHPIAVAVSALLFGVKGVALAVMVTTAALPIGANAYLFAQRYGVEEELLTSSVAGSTLAAFLTLPLALLASSYLGR